MSVAQVLRYSITPVLKCSSAIFIFAQHLQLDKWPQFGFCLIGANRRPEICISAFCNFTAFAALARGHVLPAGLSSLRWEYSKSLRSSDFSVVCGGNSLCLPKTSQPCSRGNKVFPSTQSCLSTGLSSRSETLRRWRQRQKCCNSVRGLLIRWVATISLHLSALPKVADRTLRLYCRKGGLTSLKIRLLYFLPTDWVEQDRQTTQNNLRSEKNTKATDPL